jgi:hypothetical protein
MLEFLIPPAFYLLSRQYSFVSWTYGTGEFDGAFFTAVCFICITATAAVLVDAQILLKMFVGENVLGSTFSSKRDIYVMLNWACSFIVMFTLPSVMSGTNKSLAAVPEPGQLLPSTKAAIILGFSSISYLMGYFGILLELKKEDSKAKNTEYGAWKQYVPPLFYLVITTFAFRAHSTIAVLIASIFFAVYVVNIILNKFTISEWFQSNQVACDPPSTAPEDSNLYRIYSSPPGNETKKWLRQISYDLTVYILPLTAVPLALPFLQIPMGIICLISTIWKPIYEYIAKAIFLQNSPPQERERTIDRKSTYYPGSEFPKGWFRVLNSNDLPRSRVKYVQAMGRDLAIFRGEDGKVRCIDAYCIHLGE